jgi:hypothetical protein
MRHTAEGVAPKLLSPVIASPRIEAVDLAAAAHIVFLSMKLDSGGT